MVKSLTLRNTLRSANKNEVLIPTLIRALNNPNFSGFSVDIEPWTERPYDGYFHPSTQSTWNVRQLALYLMMPDLFEKERMELTSIFAITQGHFWHMFVQHILKEDGICIEDEVGFIDEQYRRRGHMDGLLNIKGELFGLELKTINPYKLPKLNTAQDIFEQKYEYYGQAQEYLDYFDLPAMYFLFLSPSYPFPMKEIVVPADKDHQAKRRKAYSQAIEIAESGDVKNILNASCCGKPTSCPAIHSCPTARICR